MSRPMPNALILLPLLDPLVARLVCPNKSSFLYVRAVINVPNEAQKLGNNSFHRTSHFVAQYLGHFGSEFQFVIPSFALKRFMWVRGSGSPPCLLPQAASLSLFMSLFPNCRWTSPLEFSVFSNFVIAAINFILVKEQRLEGSAWVIQQHSGVFGMPVTTPQFVLTCL